MGQGTTKQQQDESTREKFQCELAEIKNSTPDLNKLDRLYEDILQYGAGNCDDILKEIELIKRETLQHMRSMYGIQKAATNQKYIKLIENAEDAIENIRTTISRLKGTDYQEYIKVLVDQNNILLILMPHENQKINERRLATIRYISDLIEALNRKSESVRTVSIENKSIFLEKISRRSTLLKSQVQQFKGIKMDQEYNKLQEEIMSLFAELAGINSITDSKTEVMLKQTNKKIQEVLIMLDNKCENAEEIIECESKELIALRIKWASVHQQIENCDQTIHNQLKKALDEIMNEAKIYGDEDFIRNVQDSKMMLLGMQECFIKEENEKRAILEDLENNKAFVRIEENIYENENMPELITKFDQMKKEKSSNEEKFSKLNQLGELSNDLKAINAMVGEYSGQQNDHSKLDNCLMQLIRDVNAIHDGNDAEIAVAKQNFLTDVQKSMMELGRKHDEMNIGSVAEALKIFETPAKTKSEKRNSVQEIAFGKIPANTNELEKAKPVPIKNDGDDDWDEHLDEANLFGRFNQHLNYFKSKTDEDRKS